MSNSNIQQPQDEITLSSSTNNSQYSYDTIKKGDKNQQQDAYNINGLKQAIQRPRIISLLNKQQDTSNFQLSVEQNDANNNQVQKSEGDIVVLSSSNNLKQSCYEFIQEGDKDLQQQIFQNVSSLIQDKNRYPFSYLLNEEQDPSNSHQELSQNNAIVNEIETQINHKKDSNKGSTQTKVLEETEEVADNQWSVEKFKQLNPMLDERFKLNQDEILNELVNNSYYLGKFLAQGGEGYIFKGFIQKQGNIKEKVAFKILIGIEKSEIQEEIKILNLFEDQINVIKYFGFLSISNNIHILILEKCKHSLNKELKDIQHKAKDFPARKLFKMILDLFDGLIQFRMYNILHLDIKPDNILITQNGDYIFTDFGLSQLKKSNEEIRIKGYTKKYAPQEQLLETTEQLDYSSDIYSLGKTIEDILKVFEKINENNEINSYVKENIVQKMTCEQQKSREKCEDLHKKLIFELIYGKFRIYYRFLKSYSLGIDRMIKLKTFDNNKNSGYCLDLQLYYNLIQLHILLIPFIRKETQLINNKIFKFKDENGLNLIKLILDSQKIDEWNFHYQRILVSLKHIGQCFCDLGDYENALKYQLVQHKIVTQLYEENHDFVYQSLKNIQISYQVIGDYKNAQYYHLQLAKRSQLSQSNKIHVESCFYFFGLYLSDMDYNQNALGSFNEQLQILKKTFQVSRPKIANCLTKIGMFHQKMSGDYQNALGYTQESLKMSRQLLKGNHPDNFFYLNSIGVVYLELGDHQNALKYFEDSLKMSKEIFKENHPHIALSLNHIGEVYYQLGQYENALKNFQASLEISKKIDHLDIGFYLNQIGEVYLKLEQYDNALKNFQDSLKMRKQRFGKNHPDIVLCLNYIGKVYLEQGDHENAFKNFSEQLKMSQELFQGNDIHIAESLDNIGFYYQKVEDNETALKNFQDSYNIKKEIFKGNHPMITKSLNKLGSVYLKLGDHQNALQNFQDQLTMSQELFQQNHLEIILSYNNLGSVYIELGQNEKALTYFQDSLKMAKLIFKENHPQIALSLNYIGSVYCKQGDFEGALTYLEESFKMRKQIFKGNHSEIALSLNNLGKIYSYLRDTKNALKNFLDSLKMSKKLFKGNHPNIAESLNNIGEVLNNIGYHKAALNDILKSLEMRRQLFKGNHHDIVLSLNNIGIAYLKLGDNNKALTYFLNSLKMSKQLYQGNHPYITAFLMNIIDVYKKMNDYKNVIIYQLDILQINEQSFKGNNQKTALVLNTIGIYYQKLGDNATSLQYFKDSLQMFKCLFKGNHSNIATSLHNIGMCYSNLGYHNNALINLLDSLKMRKELFKGYHPDVALSLNNVGLLYRFIGDYKNALDYFLELLQLSQQSLEGNHFVITQQLNDVGACYRAIGDNQNALIYFLDSLERRRNLFKGNHPYIRESLSYVWLCCRDIE